MGGDFSINNLLKQLMFVQESDNSWFWYMPMIVGLYLWLPLVGVLLSVLKKNKMYVVGAIPILFLFLMTIGINQVNIGLNYFGKQSLQLIGSIFVVNSVYVLYMLAGYFLSTGFFDKVPTIVFVCGSILGFGLEVLNEFLAATGISQTGHVFYNDLGIFITGISLFGLIMRFCSQKKREPNKLINIEKISRYAFGIYLLHGIILPFFDFNYETKTIIQSRLMRVMLLALWGFAICFLILNVLKKLVIIRKLFMIKE